jgi:AraC-like DNA-binding protein
MSLDDLACELLDAAEHIESHLHPLYRPAQLRSYAQRVGAAREMIDARPADRHSLVDLATAVGMSPFVFARLFRELVGAPPHQYLLRVRLNHARALLAEGMSVTNACYAAGFNNLSHFITIFRARYGGSPSEFKAKGKS